MKLINLTLNNFRQHRASQIDFSDGLTGLIGNNGAGKSSLVEALTFALYGSRALRGKVDDVRTFGIASNAKTSVELTFNSEGINYRIYRDLSNAQIYLGGQNDPLVSGNKAVVDRVVEILGLTLEEFIASYYTEQKSLEFLSGKKGTAERERFIIRMIGYDRLEKIQTLLREERRDLKLLVAGLTASLGEPTMIEERIAKEDQQLQHLKFLEQEAIKVLTQAEVSYKASEEDLKKIETLHQDYVRLKQQLGLLEHATSINNLKFQQLQINNQALVNKLSEELGEDFKLDLLLPELDNLQGVELEVQAKIESLILKLQDIKQVKSEKLSQLKSDLAVLSNQVLLTQKKRSAINKLQSGGECPTCGQLLGDEFRSVANKLALEEETQNKLATLKQLEVERVFSDNIASVDLERQLTQYQIKLEEVRSRLSLLRACQQEILKLQSTQEEEVQVSKEAERLALSSKDLIEQINKLNYSEYVYIRIKADADNRLALLNTARLQKVRNEGEVGEVEALLRRSKEELLEYQQKGAVLNVRKGELITLEQSDQVLSDFRKHLNSSIRPRLAELASSYLAELSDGRYSNVQISEDFTPIVLEDGYEKSVLSGGEEDLLDLCLRLSLSSLITERAGQNLSFLILDEVFGSLDYNRRFNVLTLLEKLQNRFEQIILITHLDDIKDGVANLIEVSYDETSGVVEIQKNNYSEML